MRFWDTSALIPLVVSESHSNELRQLMREDSRAVISFVTPVELSSAIARRLRYDRSARRQAREFMFALQQGWTEILPDAAILATACRMAWTHRLRSGDAIQLACAMTVVRPNPIFEFVTLDSELIAAARAEGFVVPIQPHR